MKNENGAVCFRFGPLQSSFQTVEERFHVHDERFVQFRRVPFETESVRLFRVTAGFDDNALILQVNAPNVTDTYEAGV